MNEQYNNHRLAGLLTESLITDREELARLIMAAALEKVEKLGFCLKVGNTSRYARKLDLRKLYFYEIKKEARRV